VDYDHEKWGTAAEALREAIELCHEAGHELFDFNSSSIASLLNEKTVAAMQVRGAVTERWNKEIIWGESQPRDLLQRISIPPTSPFHQAGHLLQANAPTLRVVEQFYTDNGVPVEEDKDWVDVDLFELKEGDEEHKYYIEKNYETINLHFNREARFYGSVSFDGGTFFGFGNMSDDLSSLRNTYFKYASVGGFRLNEHSATGYLVKKVVNMNTAMALNANQPSMYHFSFPIIRLADLYLMYAEVLNEYKEIPDAEVYEYIDLVRNRTGLDGVVESWAEHSVNPQKPLSKEGMREIIQRERMNELAFEGIRFWDLRRWKLSEDYMNSPIRGLSILEDDNNFYQVQNLYNPTFEMKDYLWPLKQSTLLKNRNLTQNPGW
jgi:starch-binding outer membrane protein, SusD/RagB family